MNTATLALWSPLQGLLRWLAPAATVPGAVTHMPCDSVRRQAALGSVCAQPLRRPLRVVRVLEAGQPHTQVGRMVISGRMADVCAELDRLAAGEAA